MALPCAGDGQVVRSGAYDEPQRTRSRSQGSAAALGTTSMQARFHLAARESGIGDAESVAGLLAVFLDWCMRKGAQPSPRRLARPNRESRFVAPDETRACRGCGSAATPALVTPELALSPLE